MLPVAWDRRSSSPARGAIRAGSGTAGDDVEHFPLVGATAGSGLTMMSRNDSVVLGILSVTVAMFLLGVGFGLLLGC